MQDGGLWPSTSHLLSDEHLTVIASEARKADADHGMSEASVEVLKRAGYLRLAIPAKFSGLGASLSECCAVQYRLGMVDPALAIGMNMHLFTLGILVEHWLRKRDMSWMLMEATAKNNTLVASAFAEPNLGGNLLRSHTIAKRVKGGYLLHGVKVPCSLARRCDVICLQALTDETGKEDRLIVGMLPAKSTGIEIAPGNRLFGMRASESEKIVLSECFLPDSLVFHRTKPGHDSDEVFSAGLIWFCLTATSVYLGLIRSVLDEGKKLLHKLTLPPLEKPRALFPSFQGGVGDLVSTHLMLDAACLGIAQKVSAEDMARKEMLPAALALRQQAALSCSELVTRMMEYVGGASYAESSTLSRCLRDVHAILFHPPTRMTTREVLGRYFLHDDLSFELLA